MAIRVLIRPAFHNLKSIVDFQSPKTQSLSTVAQIPVSPRISPQSPYRKQISIFNLFQRHGFPPSQLHEFLKRNHFIQNYNLHELEKSLGILFSFQIPQKFIISLITDCPKLLEFEFLKKWEAGVAKLGVSGASPSMIRNVLEFSRRFELGPDDVSRCVKVLKGLGFGDGTVCRVLEEFPMAIMLNESQIRMKIQFLLGIGIPENAICGIFHSLPGILGFATEYRLKPLLDEFVKLGFSENVIRREIYREPQILGMRLGEMSRCLEFLETLKCRVPIKEKIFSKGELRAGFEVKLRVDCLCSYGLTRREAFEVLWKEPRVIVYDIDDIEEKLEFLLHRMRYNVGCLMEVPEYLGVNFDKQIVSRWNVIEYLKSKGGLGYRVGLKGLIESSRLKFYNLYVKPYPECEKLFGRFSRDVEVRNRHPVGLWKLMKPQKHPESEDDVRNMKFFMESLEHQRTRI